jgi:Ala-tRNA(Pro) deacylase
MAIPASISEFLDRHHARYSVLTHPAAYTAQEEAGAAHVPGPEWAKVVVCIADDRPLLAVLPATLKVDLARVKDATHASSVRLAHEDEFKGLYTDCEIGAMPPLGPLYRQEVVVEETLTDDREIVFDAGSHRESIRMPYTEFERLVRPTVAAFGIGRRPLETGVAQRTSADAVCDARVSEDTAWGWSEYQGQRYYFCSQACKMEFDDNPAAYARAPTQADRPGRNRGAREE